jgi:hypothetical protein
MPGVSCGYRSNYLTIARLILLTTGAARCKACAAGLSLPNTGIVGGSILGEWVCTALDCLSRAVFVQALQRTHLSSRYHQMSANKSHKPGKRKTLNCADL